MASSNQGVRLNRRLAVMNYDTSRKLRLRGEDTGIRKFQFHKELVLDEGSKRINDFQYSLRYLLSSSREALVKLSAQAQLYGYSFTRLLPIYPNRLEKYELSVDS